MNLKAYKSVEQARSNGALVIQEPQKVNETIIAMVQDHDGYQFKFIQCLSAAIDPLSQIMLRVQDLNISVNFYSKVHYIYIYKRS